MKRTPSLAMAIAPLSLFFLSDNQSWAETIVTKSKICPKGAFPDLSNTAGAGTGDNKPSNSASCSSSELKVISNEMIIFPFEQETPKVLSAQEWTW